MRASIIVPAYNAEAFVGQAIESVLSQTEPDCEILVIDDASKDGTASVVARKAEQDRRVQLLRNTVNLGPAATRNRGIARASGDWVVLLDADDTFHPQRIGTLVSLGERHGADMVADNLLLCPEDSEEPERPMLSPAELPGLTWLSAAAFVDGNIGSRHTPRINYGFLQPVIRRQFLQTHGLRYDERNRFGEDFMLALSCLLAGARWLITPEALYRYRVRAGTLTDIQSAGDLSRIGAMEEALLRDNPHVAADPALVSALRRHHRKVQYLFHYRAFADAMKARAFDRALGLLFHSTGGFRNIVAESLIQVPRIAAKALSGGYGADGRTPAHTTTPRQRESPRNPIG